MRRMATVTRSAPLARWAAAEHGAFGLEFGYALIKWADCNVVPAALPPLPAPVLGQHTEEVLREFGLAT